MLSDKLREGAHGKVFKLLFVIIMFSFVFAGIGSYMIVRNDNDPAQIGETKISANVWKAQYDDQVRAMQRQYGPQFNKVLSNKDAVSALRLSVLERLIDNVAVNTVTYEQGIRISDKQVKEAIVKEKAFQKNGKFSQELFNAATRNMGSSPDSFANSVRNDLATDLLFNPVFASGSVAYPYEIELLSKLFSQKRVVDIYTVDTKALEKSVKLTDDEIKSYYDANHGKFMKPASVNFNYIVLSVDALKKDVAVTDEELENYYNLNQSDFTVPSKRAASQIIIRSSEDNFAEKAKEALAQLKSGASFESVGKKYSSDKSFEKTKGSLGTLEKGSLSKELDVALFNLKNVGDYSEVIVDNYGAHIIRLDKITDAYVPALKDIKADVTEKYVSSKALEKYNKLSQDLTDITYENPDSLDIAAEKLNLKVLNSGNVVFGQTNVAWPLGVEEVQSLAFNEENRTSHTNTNVINITQDSCIVINVNEYNEEKLLPFDEVKSKAHNLALDNVVSQKAQELLEKVKEQAKAGTLNELDPLVLKSSDLTVARGQNKQFSDVFTLSVFAIEDSVNSGIIADNYGKKSLAILKKTMTENEEEMKKYVLFIRSQLAQFKLQKLQSVVTKAARELTDVEYNESAINSVIKESSSNLDN